MPDAHTLLIISLVNCGSLHLKISTCSLLANSCIVFITAKYLRYFRVILRETVMYMTITPDNAFSCMFRKLKEIWASLVSATMVYIYGMKFLNWEQVHLFMQEYEKESPGWLSFPAKKIKIIYIKYSRWLFYWNERIFAITSCYLQQGGANEAIITASSQNWIQSKWLYDVVVNAEKNA